MKKIITALIISTLVCLSFCGCGESAEEKSERLRNTNDQLSREINNQQQRINDFQSDWNDYKRLESEYKSLR